MTTRPPPPDGFIYTVTHDGKPWPYPVRDAAGFPKAGQQLQADLLPFVQQVAREVQRETQWACDCAHPAAEHDRMGCNRDWCRCMHTTDRPRASAPLPGNPKPETPAAGDVKRPYEAPKEERSRLRDVAVDLLNRVDGYEAGGDRIQTVARELEKAWVAGARHVFDIADGWRAAWRGAEARAERAESELDAADARCKAAEAKLAEANRQLDEIVPSWRERGWERTRAMCEVRDSRQTIAELHGELASAQREAREAVRVADAATTEIDRLREQLRLAQSEVQVLTQEVERVKERVQVRPGETLDGAVGRFKREQHRAAYVSFRDMIAAFDEDNRAKNGSCAVSWINLRDWVHWMLDNVLTESENVTPPAVALVPGR